MEITHVTPVEAREDQTELDVEITKVTPGKTREDQTELDKEIGYSGGGHEGPD